MKQKKIVEYDITVKKKADISTFPPKFYSYLEQQDELLAYSKK